MNTYKSHNTTVLCWMMALLGLTTLYAAREKSLFLGNELFANILGSLLLFTGIFAFVWNEEIEIEFNDLKKSIVYKSKNILGTKYKDIPYGSVDKVLVHCIGKPASYTSFYFISIRLTNNRILKTGRYFLDESDAYNEAQKMADTFGCSKMEDSPRFYITNEVKIIATIFSFLSATLLYMYYYKTSVGPWTEAMWIGFMPPLFILMVALILFSVVVKIKG